MPVPPLGMAGVSPYGQPQLFQLVIMPGGEDTALAAGSDTLMSLGHEFVEP
jgi:hypothetical protein